MIGKVLKDLEEVGIDSLVKYDIELMSKLYFDGNEEELAEFFYNNRDYLETEESLDLFLGNNFPLMLFLKLLGKELKVSTGVVDLIKVASNEKLKELIDKIPDEHLNMIGEFYSDNKEEIKEVAFGKLGIEGLEKELIKKKLFSTTKSNIAVEFGVDIKTLNKWLVILFKDRFNGVRKIYYDEYIEIFKALFLAKDEKLELVENINLYKKRIEEGVKYRKKDIAKMNAPNPENIDLSKNNSGLLKVLKGSITESEFYLFTDVFPYSIMKDLIEESEGKRN